MQQKHQMVNSRQLKARKSIESLKKQFKIVKASEEFDDEKKSTQNIRTSQEDMNKINDEDYQNYLVKVEAKREFADLGDTEYQPVLDLIFHESNVDGLPVVFSTNRDFSRLDDTITQTPSYLKLCGSLQPDIDYMARVLGGLIQSFPDEQIDNLLYDYIEKMPGIEGKLTEEMLSVIKNKAVTEEYSKSE